MNLSKEDLKELKYWTLKAKRAGDSMYSITTHCGKPDGEIYVGGEFSEWREMYTKKLEELKKCQEEIYFLLNKSKKQTS